MRGQVKVDGASWTVEILSRMDEFLDLTKLCDNDVLLLVNEMMHIHLYQFPNLAGHDNVSCKPSDAPLKSQR